MKFVSGFIYCLSLLMFASCQKEINSEHKMGYVKITFKNMVKGTPMILNTNIYTNNFGEQYNISKFKYYISHVTLSGTGITSTNDGYYLIDESNASSLSFNMDMPVNDYSIVSFLLGVDSVHNVSGAQTGALDPLNDMFWTWNSGYIMAKMEGTSPQSSIVNNKVEYHIGGFAGVNSVLKNISLVIPISTIEPVKVREGKTSEVIIIADFDKWWQGIYDLKITTTPSITHPGAMAKSIADNYATMFSIADIINN